MDHSVDIDGEQDVAAEAVLATVAAMLGRLAEFVWKQETAKKFAGRSKHLGALRGLISRIALLLLLATRLVARWIRRAADMAEPVAARAPRHLHHPPQAWSAP